MAAYDLDQRDAPILLEVSRCLDEIEGHKAMVDRDGVLGLGASGQVVEHPSMQGLRSHRATLEKLLVRLALPDLENKAPMTTAQQHGKTAADARWAAQRARNGMAG